MLTNPKIVGNREFLHLHKIAFFCSRNYPEHIKEKALAWAKEQCDKGNCVISGFHSEIEKEVFRELLKGSQPIILALARGLKKQFEPEISWLLAKNRLLIVTPFDESVKRVIAETAQTRNEFMMEFAVEIFIAYAVHGGNLEKLLFENHSSENRKPVTTIDCEENRWLIEKEIAQIMDN